jgi:Patatin-like phospholipase
MHRAGIEPDRVIGTSIGAINAALIAGNRPGHRVQRLPDFWQTVAFKGLPALWSGLPSMPDAFTTAGASPASRELGCRQPRFVHAPLVMLSCLAPSMPRPGHAGIVSKTRHWPSAAFHTGTSSPTCQP